MNELIEAEQMPATGLSSVFTHTQQTNSSYFHYLCVHLYIYINVIFPPSKYKEKYIFSTWQERKLDILRKIHRTFRAPELLSQTKVWYIPP